MAILAPLRHGRSMVAAFLAIALVFSASLPVSAGESGAGTFGAPFLRIPAGARLTASPDIVAGMDPDASLVFSNPALVSELRRGQVFFSTSNWLDEMRFSAAGGVMPLPRLGMTLFLGTSLLYSGGLKGYDETLNVVKEENYFDLSVRTGITKHFDGTGLSVGVGGTYIRQHIYPQDGDGFAFTVGATYRLGRNLLHLATKDLGGRVSFPGADYAIDTQTILGAGRTFELRYGYLNAGTQVVFSRADHNRIQLGFDYRLNHTFSLHTSLPDAFNAAGEDYPFSAGFGVRYGQIAVEYAYTPREYFSNTHTFSLAFSVSKPDGRALTGNPDRPTGVPVTGLTTEQPIGKAITSSAPLEKTPAPTPSGPKPERTIQKKTYLIIAGIHGSLESAKAEVRTLKIQDVTAKIESKNAKYRVVVGRYATEKAAKAAFETFRKAGHLFLLVED